MEAPITITIRHGLTREAMLELRDELLDALHAHGIVLDMTIGGNDVRARHKATTTSIMDSLVDEAIAARLERRREHLPTFVDNVLSTRPTFEDDDYTAPGPDDWYPGVPGE